MTAVIVGRCGYDFIVTWCLGASPHLHTYLLSTYLLLLYIILSLKCNERNPSKWITKLSNSSGLTSGTIQTTVQREVYLLWPPAKSLQPTGLSTRISTSVSLHLRFSFCPGYPQPQAALPLFPPSNLHLLFPYTLLFLPWHDLQHCECSQFSFCLVFCPTARAVHRAPLCDNKQMLRNFVWMDCQWQPLVWRSEGSTWYSRGWAAQTQACNVLYPAFITRKPHNARAICSIVLHCCFLNYSHFPKAASN